VLNWKNAHALLNIILNNIKTDTHLLSKYFISKRLDYYDYKANY